MQAVHGYVQLAMSDLDEQEMIVDVVDYKWVSRGTCNAVGVCPTASADKICDPIVYVALVVMDMAGEYDEAAAHRPLPLLQHLAQLLHFRPRCVPAPVHF